MFQCMAPLGMPVGIQRQINHPTSSYKPCKVEKPGLPQCHSGPTAEGPGTGSSCVWGRRHFSSSPQFAAFVHEKEGICTRIFYLLSPPTPHRLIDTQTCAPSPLGGVLGKRCPKRVKAPSLRPLPLEGLLARQALGWCLGTDSFQNQ